MFRTFVIPGQILLIFSSIILTLSSSCRLTSRGRDEVHRAVNLCSQNHCRDCASSEVLICSNGARLSSRGDLCGCCPSCVQLRDFGESCGSQLAVRSSSANFEGPRPRVTVLATANCRRGLVCINLTCERLDDDRVAAVATPVELRDDETMEAKLASLANDAAGGLEDFEDLRTNVINSEKSDQRIESQNRPRNNEHDFSELHLVNVEIAGREFQLIHGGEALADLKILLDSVNKSGSSLILDEIEASVLYERFKDVLEPGKQREKAKDIRKDSEALLAVLRKFSVSSKRSSKLQKPRIRQFRRKRELEDGDEDPSNGNEYSEVVVYDFSNKTPRTTDDPPRHWLIARQVGIASGSKLLSEQRANLEGLESAINIRITGIPKITKSPPDFDLVKAETRIRRTAATAGEDYDNYDDELEIFVTDANTENVSEFSSSNSANFTTSEISRGYESDSENESAANQADNLTEKYSHADESYEFSFPETPVNLESDECHEMKLRTNETVEEFKAQLNRIEEKVVVIENSLYNALTNFETNERLKNIGNGETVGDTSISLPNSRSSRITKSENSNPFVGRFALTPQRKDLSKEFVRIPYNRQWRTVKLQSSPVEDQTIFRSYRPSRYANRNRGNRMDKEVQQIPRRRNELPRRPQQSSENRESVNRKILNVNKIQANTDGRRISQNIRNSPRQVVWPLNPVYRNAATSTDSRSKRKSGELHSRDGIDLEIEEIPRAEESVEMLETQISKPAIVRAARMSKDFDGRMRGSSMNLASAMMMMPIATPMKHSPNTDEEDWNPSSWDEEPSLNLFVVNRERSDEFQTAQAATSSSNGELPRSFVLAMETEDREIDDSWRVAYPAYLDYSDDRQSGDEENDAGKEETPVAKVEATESLKNLRRTNRRTSARKKRDVTVEKANETTDVSSANNRLSNLQDNNSFGRRRRRGRAKRGVQMVDWLRAAQEYHERLHQVRNAALKSWLASRDQLAATNLTDVKLFTREVPTHLEKYKSSFTAEDDSALKTEASHVFSMQLPVSRDSQSLEHENGESFAGFSHNQSSPLEGDSKRKIDSKNTPTSGSEMNSSTARKFTIIATGNSSIRIEEVPPEMNRKSDESLLEDQSAEGAGTSELFASSDSEDAFDHMYESFDAEEEDFDYGDPNFALSRWLDEVDIIDASSVEIPENITESITSEPFNAAEDYEVDELLSRTKRDSPLFLFAVKGKNPRQEVLIWPSNWKDFIKRQFKRNHVTAANTATSNTKPQTSRAGVAEFSSAGEKSSEQSFEEHSNMELDSAKKLQHAFDNRPRQSRRKNNIHRSNIANYK